MTHRQQHSLPVSKHCKLQHKFASIAAFLLYFTSYSWTWHIFPLPANCRPPKTVGLGAAAPIAPPLNAALQTTLNQAAFLLEMKERETVRDDLIVDESYEEMKRLLIMDAASSQSLHWLKLHEDRV